MHMDIVKEDTCWWYRNVRCARLTDCLFAKDSILFMLYFPLELLNTPTDSVGPSFVHNCRLIVIDIFVFLNVVFCYLE